jgi:hypothetical protein
MYLIKWNRNILKLLSKFIEGFRVIGIRLVGEVQDLQYNAHKF